MFPRVVRGLALGVTLVLVAPAAGADDTVVAKQHFAQGMEAFAKGEHRAAAEAFARAFALAPRGATAYNEAMAWHAAGEQALAADAFAAALQAGGMTEDQTLEAERRWAELRLSLGHVTVDAPEGTVLTLGRCKDCRAPLKVHLDPGTYRLQAVFPDRRTAERLLEVQTGQMTVLITPAAPLPTPPPRALSLRPTAPSARAGAPGEPGAEEGSDTPVLGWLALGGSAALAGTAIYLGLEALEARDRYYDSSFTDAEARDRAASFRTWTNVSWTGAAILGGVGVLAIVSSGNAEPHSVSEPGARAWVGPGRVGVEGTF